MRKNRDQKLMPTQLLVIAITKLKQFFKILHILGFQ